MWTGRYDRFSTSTLVSRTDALTAPETVHGDPAGVNFASTSPGGIFARTPAQNRSACRARFVETLEPGAMRSRPYRVGIGTGLLRDRQHRRHELVERAPTLRLRGLDHDRALHYQRKVDGGGI